LNEASMRCGGDNLTLRTWCNLYQVSW